MKARFIKVRWLPGNFKGMTIAPFILYRGVLTESLKRHELVHIEQVKRHGWIKFYFLYLVYSIRYGYRNNPFEIEAYK
jgi:hypothetical protein